MKLTYPIKEVIAAAEYIAEHNPNFLDKESDVFDMILRGIRNYAADENVSCIGTAGYTILFYRDGIVEDEVLVTVLVDPCVGDKDKEIYITEEL